MLKAIPTKGALCDRLDATAEAQTLNENRPDEPEFVQPVLQPYTLIDESYKHTTTNHS